MKKALIFMGMGLEIGFLIVGAYFLSEILDQKYKTKGVLFVVLSLLLLLGWLIQILWMLKRFQDEEEEETGKNS